ncbi:MAG: UvrD-helicase domain-containing protein [Bacteroidetes bacterium]|nr:UvrD-helicase domain-containing protein [Bacteroidota bacterium]
MSTLVSDQIQRLQALNPEASFIVQAPAGSGKTELLIQRFLVLLARVEFPEAIIAITFTRKAAAEMRHRIVGALQKATGKPPEAEHERHTWDLARQALSRNDQMRWDLLNNPLRLRIQTIDSLCSFLVRRMPWMSRMGALLEPEEAPRHLYRKAAIRTLELLYSDQKADIKEAITVLLRHLDNQTGRLEELLSTMLGRRDQWIRHVDVKETEFTALRAELEAALSSVIQHKLDRIVAVFPPDDADNVVELIQFAAKNLRDAGRKNHFETCLNLDSLPGSGIEEFPKWLAITELLLTREGNRRRSYTVASGFPVDKPEAKKRIRKIDLEQDVIAQLHALRDLPPAFYKEEQWQVLTALIRLLPEAVIQLREVFQQEGCVDFTEIAIAAQKAMKAHVSSNTRAPILDMSTQHLLVDEFQDTSQSQYELLKGLTHGWDGNDRTLFLVGDPMQSIYRFRDAEVGLFSRTRTMGLGSVHPQSLVLETNFRSSTEIVNWVNQALGNAFPRKEDPITGGVSYSPSTAFRADMQNSAVKIYPFYTKNPEVEAERIVSIIERTRSKEPDSTIAILVQARTHLLHIIARLRKREIAFRSIEIDPLRDRPAVQDLLALTQALLHPGNRIAWLSILRAPWCGLTLADLQILVGDDFKTGIQDLLPVRKGLISHDGRRRLERFIPILHDACTLRGLLPVRRWVEGVWMALGGPACLETRGELEDATAYLDLLEKSVHGPDLRDERKFMEDVERLFAPSDIGAGGELQLLTVHKAKGLEFDTVILPGLGNQTREDKPRLLMWREFDDGQQSNLLLAPIRETGARPDPVYKYLQLIEKKRRDHEKTRLLYVAATRARKNLYLLGHVTQKKNAQVLKVPDSRSMISKIWKVAHPEFLEAWKSRQREENENEAVEENSFVGIPVIRLSSEWTPVEPNRELTWKARGDSYEDEKEERELVFEWVGDVQRRVGIVVHRILQQMQVPSRMEFGDPVLRSALRHEGLSGENLEQALARVKQALKNTVEDPRGRWILSKHEEDAREYAITVLSGSRVRRFIVDRTFVTDGIRWIVDYKTSTHSGGDVDNFLDNEKKRYESKMQVYAKAMQSMDARPIRLGLYFPALKGWRQWQFLESEDA